MKQSLKLTLMALALAFGSALATSAATVNVTNYYTNYWVQDVTFKLTAYVQASSSSAVSGTLTTKNFLQFLSGLTNAEIITGTNHNGGTTNVVYGTNGNFLKLASAKLICKNPIVVTVVSTNSKSYTNLTTLDPRFFVRSGSGHALVDVPVNTFVHPNSSYLSVSDTTTGEITSLVAFDELDFSTSNNGTFFNFVGFDNYTYGPQALKNRMGITFVPKQRVFSVSDYNGRLSGTVGQRTFVDAPTLVNGTISFSGSGME